MTKRDASPIYHPAQDNQIPLRDLRISPAERQLVNDYLVKPVKNYFFPGKKKFCSDNHSNSEFDGAAAAGLGAIAWRTKNPLVGGAAATFAGAKAVEYVVDKTYCKP